MPLSRGVQRDNERAEEPNLRLSADLLSASFKPLRVLTRASMLSSNEGTPFLGDQFFIKNIVENWFHKSSVLPYFCSQTTSADDVHARR